VRCLTDLDLDDLARVVAQRMMGRSLQPSAELLKTHGASTSSSPLCDNVLPQVNHSFASLGKHCQTGAAGPKVSPPRCRAGYGERI
jgi:hypothetical protein